MIRMGLAPAICIAVLLVAAGGFFAHISNRDLSRNWSRYRSLQAFQAGQDLSSELARQREELRSLQDQVTQAQSSTRVRVQPSQGRGLAESAAEHAIMLLGVEKSEEEGLRYHARGSYASIINWLADWPSTQAIYGLNLQAPERQAAGGSQLAITLVLSRGEDQP